jgi:hypothetical protein
MKNVRAGERRVSDPYPSIKERIMKYHTGGQYDT